MLARWLGFISWSISVKRCFSLFPVRKVRIKTPVFRKSLTTPGYFVPKCVLCDSDGFGRSMALSIPTVQLKPSILIGIFLKELDKTVTRSHA